MHELSLVQSLLEILEEQARKTPFEKVNSLLLSFGRLSCIDPQALEFAFSVQSRGTRAEGAVLRFDIRPVTIYCLGCEKELSPPSFTGDCPACGGVEVLLTGGTEEMKLIEMEVDGC
ncbi:MAG: hydrogenase maturation nickel metallochaperone HypA [Syntrophaceae bacterium]|nr:hydrogenase maturation nickel metallochaperone HypA [Syntrophaceae bacterium]